MDDQNNTHRIVDRLGQYANLFELFKDHVPRCPKLEVKLYRHDDDVERIWGPRFTIWGILLNDTDQYYLRLLHELDSYVAKHKSPYGEDRLRAGITSDPFAFLSELIAYDMFQSKAVVPVIEPPAEPDSRRLLDLSVRLDSRPILLEVIMPHVPADMLRKGRGFAPPDFYLSRKIAYDICHHFEFVTTPTTPTVVLVNGLYSALDPFVVSNSIGELNQLKATSFPQEEERRAELLASRPRLFVSAVILFKSNWGSYMEINPAGPQITEKEDMSLKTVFQVRS
jgi:hypothetical protein